MGREEEIRRLLKEHAEKFGPAPTMLLIVQSINEDELTCTLVDDDNDQLIWEGVPLRPVLDGNQSVSLIPKVGTWAVVIRLESEDNWMALAFGEIQKLIIKTEDSRFEIDQGFLVKRGDDTLQKVISDLIDEIKAITVNTNTGPSSVPINQAALAAIKTRANTILRS